MTVKLGTESIRTIALFERVTKTHARDCLITDSCIYFLVDPEKVGLAIGKNGNNIKEVKKLIGKSVKVFGYSNDPVALINNLIPNIKNIETNNSTITLTIPGEDKITVIGKNGNNIKAFNEILNRHSSIKRIRLR
jgi:N utilization substance protein A